MKKWIVLMMTAALATSLAACGSAKKDEAQTSTAAPASSANAVELKITAKSFEFDQKEYKVKKGETVNISLDNKQGIHGMEISGLNVTLKGGEKKTVTFDKAGTYDIKCNVMCGAGHASMTSKLIVE